ncbi:MAG: AAA family ATPase [Planctomycetes bacterium]|nr:AAA family ATPase [Planctomycetota bacterium]
MTVPSEFQFIGQYPQDLVQSPLCAEGLRQPAVEPPGALVIGSAGLPSSLPSPSLSAPVRQAQKYSDLEKWLVPGRIPLGQMTLFEGAPGLGKSLVVFDLAAHVSRGEVWPLARSKASPDRKRRPTTSMAPNGIAGTRPGQPPFQPSAEPESDASESMALVPARVLILCQRGDEWATRQRLSDLGGDLSRIELAGTVPSLESLQTPAVSPSDADVASPFQEWFFARPAGDGNRNAEILRALSQCFQSVAGHSPPRKSPGRKAAGKSAAAHVTGGGAFQFPRDLPALQQMLAIRPDVRCVVIDSLSDYCAKPAHVAETLMALRQISRVFNVGLLVTLDAGARIDAQGKLRVSSRFRTETARYVWSVVDDPRAAGRQLLIAHRTTTFLEPPGMAFEWINGQVVWDPSLPVDRHDPVGQEQAIERFLTMALESGSRPMEHVLRLARACKFPPAQLRSIAGRMNVVISKATDPKGRPFWMLSLPPECENPDAPANAVDCKLLQTAPMPTAAVVPRGPLQEWRRSGRLRSSKPQSLKQRRWRQFQLARLVLATARARGTQPNESHPTRPDCHVPGSNLLLVHRFFYELNPARRFRCR